MLLNFGGSTGRLLAISYTDDDNDAAKISVLFSVYRKISFRMPSLLQLKLACPTAGSFHKFLNYCWVVVVLLLWVWKCWNLNFYWPHSQHFDGIHFLRVMISQGVRCCSVLLFQTQKTQLRRDEQLWCWHSISQQRFKTKIEYIHEAFQNVENWDGRSNIRPHRTLHSS